MGKIKSALFIRADRALAVGVGNDLSGNVGVVLPGLSSIAAEGLESGVALNIVVATRSLIDTTIRQFGDLALRAASAAGVGGESPGLAVVIRHEGVAVTKASSVADEESAVIELDTRGQSTSGGVLVGVRDDLVQLPGETEIVTLGNADIDDRLTVVGRSFALEKLGDQEEGLGLLVVDEGGLSSGGRSVDVGEEVDEDGLGPGVAVVLGDLHVGIGGSSIVAAALSGLDGVDDDVVLQVEEGGDSVATVLLRDVLFPEDLDVMDGVSAGDENKKEE